MQTLQVTLLATATQLSTSRQAVQAIIFQNNATHIVRIGDVNVSATRGIALAPASAGDVGTFAPPIDYTTDLTEWWLFGTAGDVIDVMIFE
jgi:hypothetical protein